MSMMMVYLITRLDSVGALACGAAIIAGVVLFCWSTFWAMDGCGDGDIKRPHFRPLITTIVVSVMVAALTPTTKEMAIIWVIPKIANNEDVQAIPADLVKLARVKLEEYLKEELKEDSK